MATATRKAYRSARKDAEKGARKVGKEARKASKRAAKRAEKVADHVKDSDALAKVEQLAARAQKTLEDAHIDERVSELANKLRESEAFEKAQAKGGELAARTQRRIADAELAERVGELADRVRDSEAAHKASHTAKKLTDGGLAAVGTYLASGRTGEKLGVEPRKRRRIPVWLAALVGGGIGYAVGMLTAPKRGEELRQDWSQGAQQLTDQVRDVARESSGAVKQTASEVTDLAEDAAGAPLTDLIRQALEHDPRTSVLPDLTINVAEGTVFIRGTVPGSFDEAVVRDIVTAVPGVEDVDLQVSAST